MRWLLRLPIGLLFISLSMYVHAGQIPFELSEAELQWLESNPVIVVANERDWPPFDYSVDGKPLGYSIDLIQLLAEKLGLQVEFVNGYSWEELYAQFMEKKIDVMPAIYASEERRNYLYFTPDYFSNPSVIVVHVHDNSISDVSDLSGKKIAGVKGFLINKSLSEELPDVEMIEFEGVVESLKAVSIGKADAYIDSLGLVAFTLEHNFIPNLKLIGNLQDQRFANPPLHMAVHKDNKLLGKMLSKALESLTRAEKNRLDKKWLELNRYEKQITFTKEQIDWINKHPVVEVGLDPDYAPYSFINDKGDYVGVAPDFLKMLSEKIGIKFVIKEGLLWTELIEKGKKKKLDVITPMVPTEQRKFFFNFSPEYIPAPLVTITHIDQDIVKKPQDLSGLRVALVKNYSSSQRVLEDHPDIQPRWVDNSLQALKLVATGEVDAFVSVIGVVTYLIREHGFSNLQLAGYYDENYPGQRFAIRSDWPELYVLISEALDDISFEERKSIYDRWISLPGEDDFDFVFFFQMLAVFSLIIILLAFYNRKLSKEILNRHKAEQALNDTNLSLIESRVAAEAANIAKTEFISSMSHELRTPLMAIIGFSDVLRLDDGISLENKDRATHIHNAGQHLLALIDDLMDLSMIESGNLKMFCEPVRLQALLDDCITLLLPLAHEKGLSMSADYQNHEEVQVNVDALRFKQVIINLLSNAIKYNRDKGSIDIVLSLENKYAQIDLRDTGIGMNQEQLNRLFNYYDRAGAEQSDIPGQGMGLAIAKKLVEAMEGSISVESEPGLGTCFCIWVPLV